MKKEVRLVDEKRGIVQVTLPDERYYTREGKDPKTGLPCIEFRPSITWKASYYPKGKEYIAWINNVGLENAERIKIAGGERGSKVHKATEDIEDGLEISLNSKYRNPTTGEEEELTAEEYEGIISFRNWLDKVKPVVLAVELVVWNDTDAGTLDRIYRINNQIWIVDLKTSKYIWPSHKLQISRYKHSDIDYESLGITDEEWKNRKIATLQLGYARNSDGYKFTPIEDCHDLYLAAAKIWANENPNTKLKQKDFPLILKSELRSKGKEG